MRMRSTALLALALLFASAAHVAAQNTLSARGASIRLGGRFHAQYAHSSAEGYSDHFFARRARLIADITVSDFLDARVQPDFAGGGADLKDAWVRLRFSPGFEVTMGQFKRPFDLFELASSTDLSIIERDGRVGGVSGCAGVGGICSYSRLTERLRFADRDMGIKVAGASGAAAWELALTNGTGTNVPDENEAKSFSGRVTVDVAEGVQVGGQVALHDHPGPDDETEYASAWGADVQWGGWRDGLLVQASVVGGENWLKPGPPGDDARFLAFQGAASFYRPLPEGRFEAVEPLLRLSWGDPDRATEQDGGMVLTPGVALYVAGRNKIAFNLDVWSPQAGDTQYSLKVQSFVYF